MEIPPTDHQELQGWVSDRNCDLRNAFEFSDHATVAKVGSLLSQGTAHLASGTFQWMGQPDRGVRREKEGGARCQQCIAIHGGGPSVRSCCGLRGVRVGEASLGQFDFAGWPKSKLAEIEIGRSRTDGVCSVSSVSAFSCFLLFLFLFLFSFSFLLLLLSHLTLHFLFVLFLFCPQKPLP